MTTTRSSFAPPLQRHSSIPVSLGGSYRPSLGPAPESARLSAAPARIANTLPPAVRAKKMLTTVRRVATKMARHLPNHVDVEELVGAGALGLADAFSRRNGMPGSEFEAFASYRVRGAMLDELRRLDAMPRRTRARAKLAARAQRVVEQRQGTAACDEDVAREMGMDVSAYQTMKGVFEASRGPIHLRSATNDEEDGVQDIADGRTEPVDATVARMQIGQLVVRGINTLPVRMREVLVGLYVEGHTLKELGLSLGVSESRVCQIHGEALTILRAELADDGDSAPPKSCTRLKRATTEVAQENASSRRRKEA